MLGVDLALSPRSLEALANSHAGEPAEEATTFVAGPWQRREVVGCLGLALDAVGSTSTMLLHRFEESDKAWWAWQGPFCEHNALDAERATRLQQTVVSSLPWGSPLWTPSYKARDLVESAEGPWLRRMTFSPRSPDEGWIPHHRKRKAKALEARRECRWNHRVGQGM